jgi:hypothetical protein
MARHISEVHLVKMLVREMILRETPLDDFVNYDKVTMSDDSQPEPTIAHPENRSRAPEFAGEKYVEVARELMKSTKDNWVIVTLSDTRSNKYGRKGQDIRDWVETIRPNYPEGTIFAVSVSAAYEGDHAEPKWQVLHDLFGHTLADIGTSDSRINARVNEIVHEALPKELQISFDRTDSLPDIFAAILLNRLTRKQALAIVEAIEYPDDLSDHSAMIAFASIEGRREFDRWTVNTWFNIVEEWLGEARRDGYVVLEPWV